MRCYHFSCLRNVVQIFNNTFNGNFYAEFMTAFFGSKEAQPLGLGANKRGMMVSLDKNRLHSIFLFTNEKEYKAYMSTYGAVRCNELSSATFYNSSDPGCQEIGSQLSFSEANVFDQSGRCSSRWTFCISYYYLGTGYSCIVYGAAQKLFCYNI